MFPLFWCNANITLTEYIVYQKQCTHTCYLNKNIRTFLLHSIIFETIQWLFFIWCIYLISRGLIYMLCI